MLAGVAVLAGVAFFACPAPAGATPYTVATEQIVLQLGQSGLRDTSSVLGGLPGTVPQVLPGERWSTDLPDAEAASVETELSGKAGVNYVSPVVPVRAADLVPNNPCYNQTCGPTKPVTVENPFAGSGATIVHPNGQTDLWAVHAAAAWGVTTGSANDLVAVLDTGVDPEQPQLKGKVVIGPDVCKDDRPLCASPYDKNGHGTFVTGIIAAATNDGLGIAGLGWDTKVIDIKVLDDTGNGNSRTRRREFTKPCKRRGQGDQPVLASLNPAPRTPMVAGRTKTKKRRSSTPSPMVSWWWQRPATIPTAPFDEPLYPASYPGVLSVAAEHRPGSRRPGQRRPIPRFLRVRRRSEHRRSRDQRLVHLVGRQLCGRKRHLVGRPARFGRRCPRHGGDPSLSGPKWPPCCARPRPPWHRVAPSRRRVAQRGRRRQSGRHSDRSRRALTGTSSSGRTGGSIAQEWPRARARSPANTCRTPSSVQPKGPTGSDTGSCANGSVFAFGDAHFLWFGSEYAPRPPHSRHGCHPRRQGLLACRQRWGRFRLRRRPLLRFGTKLARTAGAGAGSRILPPPLTARVIGWWPRTAGFRLWRRSLLRSSYQPCTSPTP